MVLATMILITSTALLFYYLQSACERVLQREFAHEFFQAIVNANRLEFPLVRQAIEEFNAPLDYEQFRMQLKCDFLALTYLLRNAANEKQRLSRDERILSVYFQFLSVLLSVFHWFGVGERSFFLRLISILQYFGNVLGERVSKVRFGNITASEYLLSL
jgi:hypothetical protein